MSRYTTGELAKLCNVSVRTVQFYDTKDVLNPTELTEGGRRLYSDSDLKNMRLICLMKSLGLSLEEIKGILSSKAPHKTLILLLDEQTRHIDGEIQEMKKRKQAVALVKEDIKNTNTISVQSISDIEEIMKGKNKLKKTFVFMVVVGLIADFFWVGSIILWVNKGIWWPFAVGMPIAVGLTLIAVSMYYRNAAYICPECNTKFNATGLWKFTFANHTAKTRYLECPHCKKKEWCVETYSDDRKHSA